jgi:hypothetical protein
MSVKQCLEYEPSHRGTCTELLKHPYFDGIALALEDERKNERRRQATARQQQGQQRLQRPKQTQQKMVNIVSMPFPALLLTVDLKGNFK